MNALLGDTFSRENNTHGSRFHDRDPQFASRILGAMTQSCYIGTSDIRSRVIRGPYCIAQCVGWKCPGVSYSINPSATTLLIHKLLHKTMKIMTTDFITV